MATPPEVLEELFLLRREFQEGAPNDERRKEILQRVQQAAADDPDYTLMCTNSIDGERHYIFMADWEEALIPGHVYSRDGLAEVRITGLCEWCFDLITKTEED